MQLEMLTMNKKKNDTFVTELHAGADKYLWSVIKKVRGKAAWTQAEGFKRYCQGCVLVPRAFCRLC
jgi:hypothetical protein